jgi:hypothetical protein
MNRQNLTEHGPFEDGGAANAELDDSTRRPLTGISAAL